MISMLVGTKNYITSPATIAAVRSAFRHELLPAKADTSAPPVTGLSKNSYAIDEHGGGNYTALSMEGAPGMPDPPWFDQSETVYPGSSTIS